MQSIREILTSERYQNTPLMQQFRKQSMIKIRFDKPLTNEQYKKVEVILEKILEQAGLSGSLYNKITANHINFGRGEK